MRRLFISRGGWTKWWAIDDEAPSWKIAEYPGMPERAFYRSSVAIGDSRIVVYVEESASTRDKSEGLADVLEATIKLSELVERSTKR